MSGAATAAAATGAALGVAGSVAASAAALAVGAALGSQRRSGFRCVVEQIKQSFTLFSPEGVPLRAKLTVTLREYKTLEDQLTQLKLSSPDRTHVHVLQQTETFAAIAQQYYEKPDEWRVIAETNGVDDPRRLSPGRFLRVPPIR